MTTASQAFVALLIVGLFIGGVMAIRDRGRGLAARLVAGVFGAAAGAFLLPLLGVRILDPVISNIIYGSIGAIILFLVAAMFAAASRQMER